MKKLIDYGRDDHPEDDEDRSQTAWTVAILDDCDGCGELRVELTLEEVGQAGYGQVAHLAPATARRLTAAIIRGLSELGAGDG